MASDNLETILGVKLILPSAAQESSGATAQTNRESDEEYDTIPVLELEGRMIKLGRLGENNTQTVKIDCSEWLTALPGCQLMIAALRPGESEIYLPGVSVASGVITWPILAQDTALAGVGRAEVRAVLGSKVKKSVLFRTRIEPALDGDAGGTPTTPPDWVQDIMGSVEASQAAAAHAEALIEEATACAINAVRFDEDQQLTDEQKATGRGNIDAVALKQGAANAGKVLLVGPDGSVTVGDAVQIDSTLQQAGLAADAAAVGTALAGKVAIDQGEDNAGKALVVGPDGNVTTGDAVQIDATLQQAGQAADAAAVGTALAQLDEAIKGIDFSQSAMDAMTPRLRLALYALLRDALYKSGHADEAAALEDLLVWQAGAALNIIGGVSVAASGSALTIGDRG